MHHIHARAHIHINANACPGNSVRAGESGSHQSRESNPVNGLLQKIVKVTPDIDEFRSEFLDYKDMLQRNNFLSSYSLIISKAVNSFCLYGVHENGTSPLKIHLLMTNDYSREIEDSCRKLIPDHSGADQLFKAINDETFDVLTLQQKLLKFKKASDNYITGRDFVDGYLLSIRRECGRFALLGIYEDGSHHTSPQYVNLSSKYYCVIEGGGHLTS